MTSVIEGHTKALIDRRMIVVLHQIGVVVAGVRIDRPFDVAFALGQQVAGIERPLVIPAAIDLELEGLVGTLGPLVTHDVAAAQGLVAVLGRVQAHPAVGIRTPQLVGFTRVDDRPVTRIPVAAFDVIDARIFHRTRHAAVGGVDAVRPFLVESLLEAKDVLVLEHLLQITRHCGAHVGRCRGIAFGIDRTDLLAKHRDLVGVTA
ncbi:hypothetical protein D3C71_918620 [compost metagenome]